MDDGETKIFHDSECNIIVRWGLTKEPYPPPRCFGSTPTKTIDGKTKKVVDYYGAPKKLDELENKIDEITNSNNWIGKCTFDKCE